MKHIDSHIDLFKKIRIPQMTFDEFNNNFDLELEYKIFKGHHYFIEGEWTDEYDAPATNVYINGIAVYQFNGDVRPLSEEQFEKIQNERASIIKKFKKIIYEDYLKNHWTELKKEIHRRFVSYCIQYGILIPQKVFDEYKNELFSIVEGKKYHHYYIEILIKQLKYITRMIKNKQKD